MKTLADIIKENLGYPGRMISMSKSFYREHHPKSTVYFNACIFNGKGKQVWWGDIDITREKRKLNKIAKIYNKPFFVTPEHSFRSDFYKVSRKDLYGDEFVLRFNI